MAKNIDDFHAEMLKEYAQFREDFGQILEAVSKVQGCRAEDDVHGALKQLEDVVKEVRTGGVFGSGAKGHREARENWTKAQQQSAPKPS
jgi:hypothetical protein